MSKHYMKISPLDEAGLTASISGLPTPLVDDLKAIHSDPGFVRDIFILLDAYPVEAVMPESGTTAMKDAADKLASALNNALNAMDGMGSFSTDPADQSRLEAFYEVRFRSLKQQMEYVSEQIITSRPPRGVTLGKWFVAEIEKICKQRELPTKTKVGGKGQEKYTGKAVCQAIDAHKKDIYAKANKVQERIVAGRNTYPTDVLLFPKESRPVEQMKLRQLTPVSWWNNYHSKS